MVKRSVVLSLFILGVLSWSASSLKTSAHGLSAQSQFPLTVVSAASFTASLADGSRASVFGNGLATGVLDASIAQTNGFPAINPSALPTMLLGTKVEITDSAAVTRRAPLFFVTPLQVDIQIPEGTASGKAQIVLTSGDG